MCSNIFVKSTLPIGTYHHCHICNDDDYHHRIFSEWSSLDLAWTSAFSLIVVTSVVGNVMVRSFSNIHNF